MQLRVLGCSGGIGRQMRTTSLLVDDDLLLDAGSGVGDLTVEEMGEIRHIFLSHSHLDHIGFIPFLVDSVFETLAEPLVIHAQAHTIKALKEHIFNWVIWPDFSKLPSPEHAVLRFEEFKAGDVLRVGEREIEVIPVNHQVPGVGFRVSAGEKSFAFSGDTSTNDTFWEALNRHERLDLLIVETAFPESQAHLAHLAHHYCPSLLAADLAKLDHREAEIYLTHLKTGAEEEILREVQAAVPDKTIKALETGRVFQL